MNRSLAWGIAAMAAIVVASNVLVQFLVGSWLTWAAFVYPFAFLVTDIMNRVYGVRSARKVVVAGFAVGVLCSLAGSFLDGPDGPLVTLRIALGSGAAFLAAQLLDIFIFDKLRDREWWKAPLVSSAFGSTVDTFLFFGIAFSAQFSFVEPSNDVSWANEPAPLFGIGPPVPIWTGLALADLFVKASIALVALGPFRTISKRLPVADAA